MSMKTFFAFNDKSFSLKYYFRKKVFNFCFVCVWAMWHSFSEEYSQLRLLRIHYLQQEPQIYNPSRCWTHTFSCYHVATKTPVKYASNLWWFKLNDSFAKKSEEKRYFTLMHILTFLGKSPNAVAEEYPMLREPRWWGRDKRQN